MKTLRSFAPLFAVALLSTGCSEFNPLGGQEGEPLGGQEGEPLAPGEAGEPPPPAVPDFDDGLNDVCDVVASCEGPAWCADYSADTLPADFDAMCEAAGGTPSDAPCDSTDATGTCMNADTDDCTVVWLYATLGDPPAAYCDSLAMDYEPLD
jgi:hypothetical protein